MMKIKLSDIREATYDANLDTEYREALAHSLMGLGYVSDSPLNLSMGTQKEKEEAGVFDDLIRISVGIEDVEDLIEDFKHALK